MFEHGKMVLFGFVFLRFNIKRFVFGVSGIVSKVLKCLVFFPSFLGFSGVAHCCSSWFGRFRCFCVSCVCFSFLCCFCFCFLCFVLGFVVGCCCFVFFVVFFGGFKGQVRWPEGPPHLALNPPYFLFCLVFFPLFCFLFFLFVTLEGLRVR